MRPVLRTSDLFIQKSLVVETEKTINIGCIFLGSKIDVGMYFDHISSWLVE